MSPFHGLVRRLRDARDSFPRPSAVEWVVLVVGLVATFRYSWFMDDAFVFFRYVDNFLFLDYGLVYNHGEYVEGFSSPLWTFFLVVLRASTLNWWLLIRLTGLACCAVFWALLVVVNRRLGPRGEAAGAVNVPLLYLGLNYAVLSWFTSGMETPFVQLTAAAFALFVLVPGSRTLQVVLALSPLLRHELVPSLALALGWKWYRERRVPFGMMLATGGLGGGYLLFRVWYYADLFPNTFHLKDTVDYARGLTYVHDTFWPYGTYFLLGAGLVAWLVLRGRGAELRTRERLAMLAMALPVFLYVIRIGGDARHYRYLAYPLCLAVCAGGGLAEHLVASFAARRRGLVLAGSLGLAALSFSFHPRQVERHPFLYPNERHRDVHKINDAQAHRRHDQITPDLWSLGDDPNLARYAEMRAAGGPAYEAVVADGICARSYRTPDKRIVQEFGLTDAFLSRVDTPMSKPSHKPGLRPLAADLAELITAYGAPGRGMLRSMVERGRAPLWISENLEALEVLERKAFNEHDLFENVELSFAFPRVQPVEEPLGREARAVFALLLRLEPHQSSPGSRIIEVLGRRGIEITPAQLEEEVFPELFRRGVRLRADGYYIVPEQRPEAQ